MLFVSKDLKKNLVDETISVFRLPNRVFFYGAPSVKLPSDKKIREFTRKFNILPDNCYILAHGITAYQPKAREQKYS